jgi:hypothetical protein
VPVVVVVPDEIITTPPVIVGVDIVVVTVGFKDELLLNVLLFVMFKSNVSVSYAASWGETCTLYNIDLLLDDDVVIGVVKLGLIVTTYVCDCVSFSKRYGFVTNNPVLSCMYAVPGPEL